MNDALPAVLVCPICHAGNPSEAHFCIECGSALARVPDTFAGATIPPADPLLGVVIADRYRVVAPLGAGGMGMVYRVEHVHIGKTMALKVLHAELSGKSDMMRRFRREAEAASRLTSRNTVQVFDFGESRGRPYLVMEFIEGRSLEALVEAEGPLSFSRVARLGAQICAAVEEAHAHGIVHRDLKPENVMITVDDGVEVAKVLDFGLAKLRFDAKATNVTSTGIIVGTPEYMSPEQIRGEAVDGRCDIYAMGALLYFACTGAPPFTADAPFAILGKHLSEPVTPPRTVVPSLPAEADAVILRALQKEADDRFPTMGEMRAQLIRYLRSSGADLTDPSMRIHREDPAHTPLRLATRADFEEFEHSAGREKRGYAGAFVALGTLAVVALAAFFFDRWQARPALPDPSLEVEPNNSRVEATELPLEQSRFGLIGQRLDRSRGDVDYYRLPSLDDGALRVELGPLPNVDLVLEVLGESGDQVLYRADAGGVGEGEVLPNIPSAGAFYLRVREALRADALPTENISDRYSLRAVPLAPKPGLEVEPNDALETAEPIQVGAQRSGYVGHAGDVDVYCLEGEGGAVLAAVTGVEGLDLALRWVDKGQGRSRRVDRAGVGVGETTPVISAAEEGRTCFEVSARNALPGTRSSSGFPYQFSVEPAPEAAEASVAPGAPVVPGAPAAP